MKQKFSHLLDIKYVCYTMAATVAMAGIFANAAGKDVFTYIYGAAFFCCLLLVALWVNVISENNKIKSIIRAGDRVMISSSTLVQPVPIEVQCLNIKIDTWQASAGQRRFKLVFQFRSLATGERFLLTETEFLYLKHL